MLTSARFISLHNLVSPLTVAKNKNKGNLLAYCMEFQAILRMKEKANPQVCNATEKNNKESKNNASCTFYIW